MGSQAVSEIGRPRLLSGVVDKPRPSEPSPVCLVWKKWLGGYHVFLGVV